MTVITTNAPATYDSAVAVLAEDHASRTMYGARAGVTPDGVGLVSALFGVDMDTITRDYRATARAQFPTAF